MAYLLNFSFGNYSKVICCNKELHTKLIKLDICSSFFLSNENIFQKLNGFLGLILGEMFFVKN